MKTQYEKSDSVYMESGTSSFPDGLSRKMAKIDVNFVPILHMKHFMSIVLRAAVRFVTLRELIWLIGFIFLSSAIPSAVNIQPKMYINTCIRHLPVNHYV